MNKANMLALASFLDTLPDDKFYMRAWLADKATHEDINKWDRAGECGTTGCVAGWAAVVAIPFKAARVNWLRHYDIQGTARRWLELSPGESRFLFHGYWAAKSYQDSIIGDATPKEAAAAIRKMVEVGGVFETPERLREFQVRLSARQTVVTRVTLQAHDTDDAEAVALEKARKGQVDWEPLEGEIHEPMVVEVDDA
jgi:hypothetical protein